MTITKTTYGLLYFLLLTPLIGLVYSEVLRLPKNMYYISVFIFLFYGIFYRIKARNIIIPKFLNYILIFGIYRLIWNSLTYDYEYYFNFIFYSSIDFATYFILVIIYNTHFDQKFIDKSIKIVKYVLVLTLIFSVSEFFFTGVFRFGRGIMDDSDILRGSIYTVRRYSLFRYVESNAMGLSFIPLLSILIGYLFKTNSKTFFVFLLMGLIIAFLTNTRYVIVGGIIVTLQLGLYYRDRIVGITRTIIVSVIVLFLLFQFLFFVGYNIDEWFTRRIFFEESITETTRYKALTNFAYFFPQRPIFGFGSMTEEILEASRAVGSSHIHVGYLSHLVAYGLFGSFFLFSFWYHIIKNLYYNAKITQYWASFFAFLAFFWSFATMSQSSILYAGLIYAFVFDKYFIDRYYKEKLSFK
jgi:hypothetical protein